jgi:hypothetical protein
MLVRVAVSTGLEFVGVEEAGGHFRFSTTRTVQIRSWGRLMLGMAVWARVHVRTGARFVQQQAQPLCGHGEGHSSGMAPPCEHGPTPTLMYEKQRAKGSGPLRRNQAQT